MKVLDPKSTSNVNRMWIFWIPHYIHHLWYHKNNERYFRVKIHSPIKEFQWNFVFVQLHTGSENAKNERVWCWDNGATFIWTKYTISWLELMIFTPKFHWAGPRRTSKSTSPEMTEKRKPLFFFLDTSGTFLHCMEIWNAEFTRILILKW